MPRPSRPPAQRARQSLDPLDVQRLMADPAAIRLLQLLGLVTEKGGASADSHRKIKQIQHFVRLVQPALDDVYARHDAPVIVDAAAGKGYLGLLIAALRAAPAGRGGVVAIEPREALVETMRRAAAEMQLPWQASQTAIADAPLPERVHFLLALHACDVATDEAIVRGIRAGADHIAVVPCCQAEVARLLRGGGGDAADSDVSVASEDHADGDPARLRTAPALAALWGRPWHRREFGALLTNVIRTLVLQANGYHVTVTELAGWEHSLKNELILARRVGRFHRPSQQSLDALLGLTGVRPWLVEQLGPSDG